MRQCNGTTKAGNPCRATPLAGKNYCLNHDPDSSEARARNTSLGGKAKAARRANKGQNAPKAADVALVLPESREDVLETVRKALAQAAVGQISGQMASSVSSLAKTLLREGAVDDGPEDDDIGELKRLPAADLEAEMLGAISTEALQAELKRRAGV